MSSKHSDHTYLDALRDRANAGEALKYLYFWGHQPGKQGVGASCFSQWYEAPFTVDDQRYPTAEHYMMAEKAALFGDQEARQQVLQASNPGAAKALGRAVRGFDDEHWCKHRFAIVVAGNRAKFNSHPELLQFLRQTGDRILVEASPVDRIWGIGLTADDPRAQNPNLWRGLNLLGFALMKVRDELIA